MTKPIAPLKIIDSKKRTTENNFGDNDKETQPPSLFWSGTNPFRPQEVNKDQWVIKRNILTACITESERNIYCVADYYDKS